jgi:anti-anti-sigma factor
MSEAIKLSDGVRRRPPVSIMSSPDAVTVGGALDATTVPLVRDALLPLIRTGARLRIDLRDVTFFGSSGLHLLADTATALGTTGRVVVVDPSPVTERVLELFAAELDIDIERAGHRRAACHREPSPRVIDTR